MTGALLGRLIKPPFTIRTAAIFKNHDLAVYNPDWQAILSTSIESTVDETNENDMNKDEALQKAADTAELLTQDLRELATAFCKTNTTDERIAWHHVMALLTEAASLRQKIQCLKP